MLAEKMPITDAARGRRGLAAAVVVGLVLTLAGCGPESDGGGGGTAPTPITTTGSARPT